MRKKIFILFFFLVVCPIRVLADDIYNVSMNIHLEKDGSAKIVEEWDVKASSGSEWYKQLYNLGNEKISNYIVYMDDKELQYKEWDISESIDEKSGYYGINYVSDGIELCFGKGDMDRHSFKLMYTLSNFIFNTDDNQVLYQTLLPNVSLDNFSVIVDSYYEFPDTLDVWGYGYEGYAYVSKGKIYMSNEGSLYNDYVVLLVKFPLNTFETDNIYDEYNTFDIVNNEAKEGSYRYNNSNNSDWFDNFFYMLTTLIPVFIIGLSVKSVLKSGYGYKDNKKIDKKNLNMFRDIPCDKDIYYANALIYLNGFSYNETNIFGAIILKWLRENKIILKNEKKGIFNKNSSVIDLTLNPSFENKTEEKLFNMMYTASKDGILEAKELEKWCRKNYNKFLNIFSSIKDDVINKLKSNHHIYKRTDKSECKKVNVMDDKIYDDSVKLYGLYKYLKEFSNMKEKEAIEVHLWDEYLMFAYLFGMADKVMKQFNNLYPEVIKEMDNFNVDYGTLIFINHISSRSVSVANSARSAAQSYSAGGGGFSSGGGGGGSFGGGGSMGGR